MRRPSAAIVAVLTLALAGCGGSTRAAHVTSTRTVTQTVTTPTPTTTTPTTTTTTTTGPTSGACRAGDLAARFLGQNGATGNIVLEFALRNVGSTPCHTYGYPGVQFLGKVGAPAKLPTAPTHTTSDLLGSTRLATVTVAPGQDMSFRIVVSTNAPTGCQTAYGLQIIAPDDTVPITVAFPGVYECSRTTVSPIQAGSGAVPGV